MEKNDFNYNTIKSIFEHMFFSTICCPSPLSEEMYYSFLSLSEKQVMIMQDLAIRCKKYEDAYWFSSNYDRYWFSPNHDSRYMHLKYEFITLLHELKKNNATIDMSPTYKYGNNEEREISLEETASYLQTKHLSILRNNSTKKKSCRWINSGETIEVHGLKLKRGLFYIGEYFKIPQSYKKIRFFNHLHPEYWHYNRNYKLSKLYGTVIHGDLPISKDELKIVPFSSYLDMHPTHRYEYLEWLTGLKRISEISSETFLFYLFGLQLRMFIDDTTTEKDRLEIIKCSVELYNECREENVYCIKIVEFIDAAISKFFVNRLEELVPKDILPQLRLCREALILSPYNNNNNGSIIENICRNIMCILNYDDSIPKQMLTDSFYLQFADMVKLGATDKMQEAITNPDSLSHYKPYCINDFQNDSLLLYDYIFNFQLFPNINSLASFFRCIHNCFKRVVKHIDEYKILTCELPGQVSSIISLFDTDDKNIHRKIHRIMTEGDEFSTIEKETCATEYTIDKVAISNSLQVSLCNERLEKVEKQTKQAQNLLSDIFKDNDDGIDSTNNENNENNEIIDILKILVTKESWTRNEVETLCQNRHLMIGSVLERINDFSFAKVGDTVIEDDGDTIYVIKDYKDKLI